MNFKGLKEVLAVLGSHELRFLRTAILSSWFFLFFVMIFVPWELGPGDISIAERVVILVSNNLTQTIVKFKGRE